MICMQRMLSDIRWTAEKRMGLLKVSRNDVRTIPCQMHRHHKIAFEDRI